jgi:hypothetical protein
MWSCLKFAYEASNWTAANQIAQNWTMWSQTKDCITISFEICALLRYYATFWDNLMVPASRFRKSKERTKHLGS